jgi:hypothetical protein
MEITIGNARYVQAKKGGGWQGRAVMFVSTRGVVQSIHVGEARLIMGDEYCA